TGTCAPTRPESPRFCQGHPSRARRNVLQIGDNPGKARRVIFSMRQLLVFVVCGLAASSSSARGADDMNIVAERYAHLVLALGQHDPDYVDAFYGPAEWKNQAEKEKKSLDAIGAEAAELSPTLAKTPDAATSDNEMLKLRREYLQKQISALAARVRMLKGEKLKFDNESRALYDAVALTFPDSHFDQIIAQLDAKIPGKGPSSPRDESVRSADRTGGSLWE